MASPSSSSQPHHGIRDNTTLPFPDSTARLMQSLTADIFSRFPFPAFSPNLHSNGSIEMGPTCLARGNSSPSASGFSMPSLFPFRASSSPFADSKRGRSRSPTSSAFRGLSTSVRVDGFNSSFQGKLGGGPAFVGQVFSLCDPSGTGLMAVTTRWDIPFLTKRTPEWIKKMFAMVTKNEKNSPVFQFFMDLGDAVAYVKRLNIPTGIVGACRLDVAYEHFKEKPHMFQFVPNEKQVKAANKLLKTIPRRSGKRKVDGVPVFTAQNLNIAIATNDGIKWYTPYFFDKSLLDDILEASIDQHFHTLIHNRHMQRRRDVIDDSFTADVVEENDVSLFEPPEVQEVLNEMGHPRIPFSVISKVAEIQMLDVVDNVLLGNRWLRKATGIQPKFPYLVDSFEERSAASVLKAAGSSNHTGSPEHTLPEHTQGSESHWTGLGDSQFPFGDWFSNPSPRKERSDIPIESRTRLPGMDEERIDQVPPNPLLPKITMVGISTGEAGKFSKASLKKTMEDLTRELEQTDPRVLKTNEEKDPLFVANVGDYSSITRMGTS